jgi:hypothetical protein
MYENKYTFRNFNKGDQKIMSDIFNQVIIEFDTEFPKFTPEQIKNHQPFYGAIRNLDEYGPEDIKFLLNSKNKEVGYIESSNRFDRYTIHYPVILKKYRSANTLNLLFKALYDNILKRDPKSIRAVYSKKYRDIHDFFRNKVHESIREDIKIHETERFQIPVKRINSQVEDFEIIPFTKNHIKTLVEFYDSSDSVVGTQVSIQSLDQGFNDGKYTEENSFLFLKNRKLLGWVHAGINGPPYDYDKSLKRPIGVLKGMILDGSTDLKSLRITMFYILRDFFLKNNIEEFRIWALVTNDPNSFYQTNKDYGFKPTKESEFTYNFPIKN